MLYYVAKKRDEVVLCVAKKDEGSVMGCKETG